MFDEVAGNTEKIVTGNPEKGIESKVAKLVKPELGYEIHVVHVDAPMHQTTRISWDRFKKTGRFVDPEYMVKDADDKPIVTYNAFKMIQGSSQAKALTMRGLRVH